MRRSIAFAFVFLMAGSALPVMAAERIYCPLPEDGLWTASRPKPKALSRVEVQSTCFNDQITVRARAYTKCSPRDCKWGWTDAEFLPGGGVRVLLRGFFNSKLLEMHATDKQHMTVIETDMEHQTGTKEAPVETRLHRIK